MSIVFLVLLCASPFVGAFVLFYLLYRAFLGNRNGNPRN